MYMPDDPELNPNKIFLDRDGDGIVDFVDLQLHLGPSCSQPAVLSAVMDLSACLGFETTGLDLPMAKTGTEKDASFSRHLYIGLNEEWKEIISKKKKDESYLVQKNEASLIRIIREFTAALVSSAAESCKRLSLKKDEKRRGFDLSNPFSNRGFFWKASGSILPYLFPYKILLFSTFSMGAAVEAVNFSARLGLESIHLSLPLVYPLEEKPGHGGNFVYIGEKEYLEKTGLSGLRDIEKVEDDGGISLLPSDKKVPDILISGDERGLREIIKYLTHFPAGSGGVQAPLLDKIKLVLARRGGAALQEPGRKASLPRTIVKDYIISDERQEMIHLLRRGLAGREPRPGPVEIQIFMARPKRVRRGFEKEIRKLVRPFVSPEKRIRIVVLNAHKPGLSWIKEIVLKEIAREEVDKVEIAFKEFKTKGLEEATRWLQEIYPVDKILARGLSLPRERIAFRKDSRIREVYRVRAWRRGKVVYENQFSPKWIAQPYLLPFPRSGRVHPCTGWVRMKMGEVDIVNQRVKTCTERVWEIYQNEILPFIAKASDSLCSRKKPLSTESLFEQLRFDIHLDYPMESLGIDQERISPLEALHEDLYFVTLDFFTRWMKRKKIAHLSPGSVLPVIHPDHRARQETMKFTLVHQSADTAYRPQSDHELSTALRGIFFKGSRIGFDLSFKGRRDGERDWLIKSIRSLKPTDFEIKEMVDEDREGMRLIGRGPDSPKGKPFQETIRSGRSVPIHIPMERPIGYGEGIKIIRSLSNLEGVRVVKEGRSFRGLPVFSVEITHPCPSTFVSRAKQILFRPTFFINCRHHANEVSSTTAGLNLSYLLVSQPRLRAFLKKANVVINPMENVDGMVILEEMLKWTPTDKLHGGRYNGAGREYYGEYFNPETPFGEAKVKPAIWERWLPDICVDDHGFPSHEWEQPFSGYAPFRFREWWIPRAFFYFYLPHLEERRGSSRKENAEVLRNWITRAISKERDVLGWSQNFLERYLRYRQEWRKGDRQSRDLIPCLPLEKRFRKTNYSYRFPHITTVDFITEVADETAQGRFLKTCAVTHLRTNLSILNLLSSLDISVRKLYRCRNGQADFIWYRERPLKFKVAGKEGR